MNLKKLAIVLSSALALGALSTVSTDALAGTATDNLSVTASVSANCTISTAAVAFGAYDPITANKTSPLDGTGTVTVTCTTGSAALITLGQGANADTGSTEIAPLRRMKDAGTNHLAYFLFSDTDRTAVWGGDTTTDVAHTGTGVAVGLTVYGRVTQDQNMPAGSYSDTVLATVSF